MRYVELRRHSHRNGLDEHLSQRGVDLARRVGRGRGAFHVVLTSRAVRTYETAVAMGFAVTGEYESVPLTAEHYKMLDGLIPENATFPDRARVLQTHALGRPFADGLRKQWEKLARSLPEGGAALVVTHGGLIDNSAVACLPTADHSHWGPSLGHCEGVRLAYDEAGGCSGELLRV